MEWEGYLGYHDVENMVQTIPLILARVVSASPRGVNTISFINCGIGNRKFDCSGMGTGQVGVPWMVTTASTNAKQREGECTGLVFANYPSICLENALLHILKDNGRDS
jgi:hypothetical protein